MALFVEGIGGTGKAVINLLKFAERVATILQHTPPRFGCAVVDQDSAGVWPNVLHQRPISQDRASGSFEEAYRIRTSQTQAAVRLLYSDQELATDIGRGFQGQPKLAASIASLWNPPQESVLADTNIVIYSDIGGTGAGLGPVRLAQLVADPRKTHVIAIVFGRYLNCGAANPTGYEWLKLHERLMRAPQSQRCRYFSGYYVNVPALDVLRQSQQIPASGINPTPALLLATGFIWRLAEKSLTGQVDQFVKANARIGPARVESVNFNSPSEFGLSPLRDDADPIVAALRACALRDDFEPLIPVQNHYLFTDFHAFITEAGFPAECMQVFQSREPLGAVPGLEVDYAGCFRDTFTSVPDPWAAATWFHKAVRNGDVTCERALRRLVALYIQGALTVIRTGWKPEGSEIFALSSKPISETDGDYKGLFARHVVGAFSAEVPFWTAPAFLPNLDALAPAGITLAINIRVEEASECGAIYSPGYEVSESTGMPWSVSFSPQSARPGAWRWAIGADVTNWQGLHEAVNGFPILRNSLDIIEGTLQVDNGYRCTMRGIQLDKRILPHDGIFVDGQSGVQMYEIQLSARGNSLSERRLAATANEQPREVRTGQTSVIVGNIVSTFTD